MSSVDIQEVLLDGRWFWAPGKNPCVQPSQQNLWNVEHCSTTTTKSAMQLNNTMPKQVYSTLAPPPFSLNPTVTNLPKTNSMKDLDHKSVKLGFSSRFERSLFRQLVLPWIIDDGNAYESTYYEDIWLGFTFLGRYFDVWATDLATWATARRPTTALDERTAMKSIAIGIPLATWARSP